HPDVRKIAERQRNKCNQEPEPPCALPKMVINERSQRAGDESGAKPDSLSPDKEIDIAMAIPGKRTCAEKHDDADNEQTQYRQEEDICAFTGHDQIDVSFANFQAGSKLFFIRFPSSVLFLPSSRELKVFDPLLISGDPRCD